MNALLVITNAPNRETAVKLAQALIDRKLAACVNILGECTSIYRWQGKVEQASETSMLIKTSRDRYEEVETQIKEMHPYELPEIIAVAIDQGLPEYLRWLYAETGAE